MRMQGANKGATTAFLISTPESGVDSIAVTYALLDPLMTVMRPLAAFISALSAGIAENLLFWNKNQQELILDRSCAIDGCCDGNECPDEEHKKHHTLMEKVVAGVRFSYTEVWGDIAVWFFIGVFIAGAITTFIPDEFMTTFLGGGLHSMLIMLVVGIPLYICATASTPVAAALILKGVSPGAALVFLLVGPATNITSLSVLFRVLGRKSTFLYLTMLSICAVVLGVVVDGLYGLFNIAPGAIIGEAAEVVPHFLQVISAVVVLAISVQPISSFLKNKFAAKKEQHTFISDFPVELKPSKAKSSAKEKVKVH